MLTVRVSQAARAMQVLAAHRMVRVASLWASQDGAISVPRPAPVQRHWLVPAMAPPTPIDATMTSHVTTALTSVQVRMLRQFSTRSGNGGGTTGGPLDEDEATCKSTKPVAPSLHATTHELLQWLQAYALDSHDTGLVAAVERAVAMGDSFLLCGDSLSGLTSADLGDFVPVEDVSSWKLLQAAWRFHTKAFVPSTEATEAEVLLWLSAYAKANKDQLLIEAVQRAKAMGDDFLLDGVALYAATPAQLVKFGAGGDTALADDWELLQFSWKAVVDAAATHPSITAKHRTMQQAWSLMVKPQVAVATLQQLRDCTDTIAYLDLPEVDTGTLRVYAMPQGQVWPLTSGADDSTTRYLVVRPCWLPLWEAILETSGTFSPGAIVSGTPGIGKSWLGNYILLQRAQQGQQAGRTILRDGKRELVTNFVGHHVESVVSQRDEDLLAPSTPEPWYISDPSDEGGTGGVLRHEAFVIITAPPNPEHYKAMDKAGAAMLYMQPWSLEELQAVREVSVLTSPTLTAEEVAERFRQFGGVPRYVFSDKHGEWLTKLDTQLKEVSPTWMAESMGLADRLPPEKHILFNYHPDHNSEYGDALRVIKMDPASPYVFQHMLIAARKLRRHELEDLLQRRWPSGHPASAEFRQQLFMGLCLDLQAGGGRFAVRSLEEHGKEVGFDDWSDVMEVEVPMERQTMFSDIAEVVQHVASQPDTPALLVPARPNRRLANAFIVPCLPPPASRVPGLSCWSDTFDERHGLPQHELIECLEALKSGGALGDNTRLHVFLAVPSALFDSFTKRSYTSKEGKVVTEVDARVERHVRQWVMKMPVGVVE